MCGCLIIAVAIPRAHCSCVLTATGASPWCRPTQVSKFIAGVALNPFLESVCECAFTGSAPGLQGRRRYINIQRTEWGTTPRAGSGGVETLTRGAPIGIKPPLCRAKRPMGPCGTPIPCQHAGEWPWQRSLSAHRSRTLSAPAAGSASHRARPCSRPVLLGCGTLGIPRRLCLC